MKNQARSSSQRLREMVSHNRQNTPTGNAAAVLGISDFGGSTNFINKKIARDIKYGGA